MTTPNIEVLKKKCETDLKYLTTKVLGLNRWSDGLHNDLAQTLDAPGDRKLILLPRGHQKTTIASVVWTIQQLLRNQNETISIYSATWKLSKDILHQIKAILQESPLKEMYGAFYSRNSRWTNDCIDIAQANKAINKNPSISTGGMDTGKTGSHCSLMIFDDIVTPENTATGDQISKTIQTYRDCLPLLDPGGRMVMIGTRYTISDLYGRILEEESRSINGKLLLTEDDRKKWREYIEAV